MFTGLVEATGRVISLQSRGEQAQLMLAIPFATELTLGESVAVNGCCLTVAQIDDQAISFDLLAQTMHLTSLGTLQENSLVNLERALLPTTRLGGHFVQGHVDDVGTILDLSPRGQDHRLEIALPDKVQRFCIDQGSIAIDGISLTIAELHDHSAVFWITPHTIKHTHLLEKKIGDQVNLEADLLAKYAARFQARGGAFPSPSQQ
jgi:riboflavin synthase